MKTADVIDAVILVKNSLLEKEEIAPHYYGMFYYTWFFFNPFLRGDLPSDSFFSDLLEIINSSNTKHDKLTNGEKIITSKKSLKWTASTYARLLSADDRIRIFEFCNTILEAVIGRAFEEIISDIGKEPHSKLVKRYLHFEDFVRFTEVNDEIFVHFVSSEHRIDIESVSGRHLTASEYAKLLPILRDTDPQSS